MTVTLSDMKTIIYPIFTCVLLTYVTAESTELISDINDEIEDEYEETYDEDDEDYSFLVSLHYKSGSGPKHICSGSVLSETWILTAAHCVCYLYTSDIISPKDLYVISGLETLEEVNISDSSTSTKAKGIYIHPDYHFEQLKNDIALIELNSTLNLSLVQPIDLKPKDTWIRPYSQTKDTQTCTAYGWSEQQIHSVELTIINNNQCKLKVNWDQICAKNSDPDDDLCQEESGGPLICDDNQVGVATFRLGCGDGPESIFTKVDQYVPWIEEVTENHTFSYRSSERRRPGRPNRPNRPGRPKPPKPGRPRPPKPGRPRPPKPGRPGRPGRPGGRPHNPHVFGSRPGGRGAYRRVTIYAGRGGYVRYGGFGYYGVAFHPIIAFHPIGLWWGRPILFYYRPWFFMDFYLLHLYFWHPVYLYHLCYGYGYWGYGPYTCYPQKPPPSYAASYCNCGGDTRTSATEETTETVAKIVSTSQSTTTSSSTSTSGTTSNVTIGSTTGSKTASTTKSTPKRVRRGAIDYRDGKDKENFMKKPCKKEAPKFYTERSEDLCKKQNVFCDKGGCPPKLPSPLVLLLLTLLLNV